MATGDRRQTGAMLSLDKLIFFVYLALMFLPSRYSLTSIETVLLPFVMILMLLKINHYQMSPMLKVMAVYFILLLIITYAHGNGDVHNFVSYTKIFSALWIIDYYMQWDKRYIFKTVLFILMILTAVNIVTMIAYPDGLHTEVNWVNEWSRTINREWFLGNSNNQFSWFFLLLIYAYSMTHYISKSGLWRFSLQVAFFINILFVIKSQSTASVIVLLLEMLTLLYGKILSKRRWRARIWIYGTLAVCILFILGYSALFTPFLTGVLGKSSTFTNRMQLWQTGLASIYKSASFGYGKLSDASMTKLMGDPAYVNLHNQVLQTLFDGGILLLTPFAMIFMISTRHILEDAKNNDAFIWIISIVCVILHMTFESDFDMLFCIEILSVYHLVSTPTLRQNTLNMTDVLEG